VRRRKLRIVIALVAFFVGVGSTPAGRQAARDDETFARVQFDDTLHEQSLSLLSGH
jgi:hypothetical protein